MSKTANKQRSVVDCLNDAGFREHVLMTPAYDKRDPRPDKNYGIGSVSMRMVLVGPAGAVQFYVITGWYLPHVANELSDKGYEREVLPADLGYHSPEPLWEGQTSMGPCDWLGGKDCYYDGSGLAAEPVWQILLTEGSDGVWRRLAEYYDETFGGTFGKDALPTATGDDRRTE